MTNRFQAFTLDEQMMIALAFKDFTTSMEYLIASKDHQEAVGDMLVELAEAIAAGRGVSEDMD